jgi:hypothetical protein
MVALDINKLTAMVIVKISSIATAIVSMTCLELFKKSSLQSVIILGLVLQFPGKAPLTSIVIWPDLMFTKGKRLSVKGTCGKQSPAIV